MKTIKVVQNQTLYDLACQHYGNVEAAEEILGLNPAIGNDRHVKAKMGVSDDYFYLDLPIEPGTICSIDPDSKLYRQRSVAGSAADITTFSL